MVETKMKEKVIEIFSKIKKFSLLNYLLYRKMEGIEKSIDLKKGKIAYFRSRISMADDTIEIANTEIGNLEREIRALRNKLMDIEKI